MEYNKKIQLIRNRMGLNQKQFSELLNVSQPTITRFEAGERVPDINVIQKLIDNGVSPLFLFSDLEDPFNKSLKLFSEAMKYCNEENHNELMISISQFISKYKLINLIKSKIEKLKGQTFFQKVVEEFSNKGEKTLKFLYYFILYIEESQKKFDFLNIKKSFINELEKFELSKKNKIVSFELKDDDKKRLIQWIENELDDIFYNENLKIVKK
jgi:transcriptional regulator with XRE-family HTH domain